MCDDVIIHNPDGSESTCENQGDLMLHMHNGIWQIPPPTPAQRWDYYTGDGMRWLWYYHLEGRLPREYTNAMNMPYPYQFIPVYLVPLDFHDPIGDLDDGYNPDQCLCAVDLEKTAKGNGYRCSKKDPSGEYDPFDTHFYPEDPV